MRIITGDALESMRLLPDCCCSTCVTSPPYYGLRNYGADGQIGLEETPEQYIERLVAIFREVKHEITENAEKLEAQKTQKTDGQKATPEKTEPAVCFDATEQLRKLADERRALAGIHQDTDRFLNDVRAIEYAVSILETMAI